MSIRVKLMRVFLTVLIFLIIIVLYAQGKYSYLESPISEIKVTYSSSVDFKSLPTVYISKKKEDKINYATAYKLKLINDSVYTVKLGGNLKLRSFRFHFEYPGENIEIKSIELLGTNKNYSLDINKKLVTKDLKITYKRTSLMLEVKALNGYFDSPKIFTYSSDFKGLYKLYLPFLFAVFFLAYIVNTLDFNRLNLKNIGFSNISLGVLILSIFLPAPAYNVALVLMALLNLKRLSWAAITSQKSNLIILSFFMVYAFNNFFISEEGFNELSILERFLPFLVLSVVLPSIGERRCLSLFPVSAFALGFGFLITSTYDAYVHQNFVFLSFDFFAKYLHPVYFSYLIFFSICYIDLHYSGKHKYILEFILFVFLIFCGSKMVFLFSLIVVFMNLLKNKKTVLLIIPLALIVIIFSPLKHRFSEIINQDDLGVLNESHIKNPNDSRINGLTLRLILWRETLSTMNGLDYVFGKGVTKETNKHLNKHLIDLGLKNHVGFNPHNQYVDTFWRTGIIGLLLLILIPVYSLVMGIKRKDKLLIQFSLFMLAVMCSESIFGRVNGIYFFTTVILLLMNTNKLNENSNTRN